MNRLLVLLLITATLAASGCTGIPEGTAADGVAVSIDWIARDPDTGDVLAQGEGLRFTVGSGNSGLGTDLETSLVGRAANQTYTFVSRDDASRAYSEEVSTPQLLGKDDAEGVIPVSAFQQQFGRDPTLNETFEFNPFYDAKVVALDGENFTYRFHIDGEEQSDPVPFVGAFLVSRIIDEELVRTLEPDVGALFTIQPSTQSNPSPLGLPPGAFRTLEARDGNVIYGRAAVSDPALADRALEFEVIVNEVAGVSAVGTELTQGQYGVRSNSPYVNGDPSTVTPGLHHVGEPTEPAGHGHGDGHEDDGHSH